MTWLAHAFKAAFQQHHKALLPALRPLLPRDGVVLDAGAHAGQFAFLFARLVPDGRVYAFEPGSYARSILRVAAAVKRGPVSVRPEGLAEAPGESTLQVPVKPPGSVRFGVAHTGAPEGDGPHVADPVRVTTVDAFAAHAGLTRLDFIKADIEGANCGCCRAPSTASPPIGRACSWR